MSDQYFKIPAMNAKTLAFAIIAMALIALLSRPSTRAQIIAELDPSSEVSVARTVCQAEMETGGMAYNTCIHRLIPNMPAGLTNIPERW